MQESTLQLLLQQVFYLLKLVLGIEDFTGEVRGSSLTELITTVVNEVRLSCDLISSASPCIVAAMASERRSKKEPILM